MEQQKTIFNYLNAIFNKDDIKYDKKIAPAYLLSLWLSHDQALLPIVERMNPYHFLLEDDIIYNYYFAAVPKGRRFIKWTKKVEIPKEQKELLEEITATYNLSRREAMLYKKLLTITSKRGIIKTENVTKNFFE